jgi:hypothetical protein
VASLINCNAEAGDEVLVLANVIILVVPVEPIRPSMITCLAPFKLTKVEALLPVMVFIVALVECGRIVSLRLAEAQSTELITIGKVSDVYEGNISRDVLGPMP